MLENLRLLYEAWQVAQPFPKAMVVVWLVFPFWLIGVFWLMDRTVKEAERNDRRRNVTRIRTSARKRR